LARPGVLLLPGVVCGVELLPQLPDDVGADLRRALGLLENPVRVGPFQAYGTVAQEVVAVRGARSSLGDEGGVERIAVVESGVEEPDDALAFGLDVQAAHLPRDRSLELARDDAAGGPGLVAHAGRDLRGDVRHGVAFDRDRFSGVGDVAVHRRVDVWNR